jgi:hypothetical protein
MPFGRIKDQPRVSHTGMDLLQAIIVSEALTQNREDPDESRAARSERPQVVLFGSCR